MHGSDDAEKANRALRLARGCAAIRLIESGTRPDLLFTDVVMPEMTGAELAKVVHKLLPDAKMLFTTGYAQRDRMERISYRALYDQ